MASSVTVRVEKATSDLLIGPDWTMNMDICDLINSNSWQAKDVLKALKKRFQHKNPDVQMLALTLLETMVKNCGDPVHFQISERKVLQEMVKIVKKRTNMQVRDKILLLLDSWQEAFGGPSGKHPHYYWAYDDIKRSGIEFPPREPDAAPVFTPPATNPSPIRVQPEHVQPGSSSSQSLHDAMASEAEPVSFSSMSSIEDAMNLLFEMLQESKLTNCRVAEDDVVVDLVDRCRANKKKLIQMLATTVDEVMLGRGLELNDRLQNVLGRYDELLSIPRPAPSSAIATSSNATSSIAMSSDATSSLSLSSVANVRPPETPSRQKPSPDDEDDDGDDDFAQLARRHTRVTPVRSDRRPVPTPACGDGTLVPLSVSPSTPPKKTEDIIDLLTMSLSVAPQPLDPEPVGGGNDDYVASWARGPLSGTEQPPQTRQVPVTPPPFQKIRTYRSYGSFSAPIAPFVPSPAPTRKFVPPYKLFDDLDVFGSSSRDSNNSSSGSSSNGSSSTSVIPERK